MKVTEERLTTIFEKTDGCCHLCHCKLAYKNYGVHGARGAWHIEHSVPRAKGGTDHLNNLRPACISCNLEKGTLHTITIRKRNGVSRAPYSRAKKEQVKRDNMWGWGSVGFVVGAGLGGPLGAVVGAVFGKQIGKRMSSNR